MALTILERPEGHQLSSTANIANVYESYGAGDAQFVAPTVHGLVDGDFIYAESDIEDYAGFWYVDAISTGIFKIKPYANGDYVQFINSGTITWYASTLTHGWSAVHLPITYRISNNLYPTNTSNTSRNITSVTDYNGYSVIHISIPFGSGVNSYDFIRIDNAADTELNKVYQVIESISGTVIIINLAYDSGNDFTGADAIREYTNYNTIVRVYAGINSSHMWNLQKPYELAATLELIPDENNEVFFSINEILKSYIQTRNNLTLGTLPNNIDFWTQFYIETAESYDDSDGYTFGTFTSNYTSDQGNFEGVAVNAKLEFKNLYSGYLTTYLMTNNAAKFLTLFTIPVIFSCGDDTPNCYNDISFLNPYDDYSIIVRKEFYSNGNGPVTVDTNLGVVGSGVIRAELEADCDYDRVDITVLFAEYSETNDFADGVQEVTGDVDWEADPILFSVRASVTLAGGQTSEEWGIVRPFFAGTTYSITQVMGREVTVAGVNAATVYIRFYEDYTGGVFTGLVEEHSYSYATSETFSLTPTADVGYMVFQVVRPVSSGTAAWQLYSTTVDDGIVSETKEFKIDCGCAQQEIRLCWLNNLGGFDYWAFTGQKDHIVEIQEALTTKKNILPQWPKSYGSQADTIRKQTLRVSNKAYTVRSQFLTEAEADAISYIKSSVLVQIINSRTDRRTVIVDTDSFVKRKDGDNTFEIAFNISFTDDIPVQTV